MNDQEIKDFFISSPNKLGEKFATLITRPALFFPQQRFQTWFQIVLHVRREGRLSPDACAAMIQALTLALNEPPKDRWKLVLGTMTAMAMQAATNLPPAFQGYYESYQSLDEALPDYLSQLYATDAANDSAGPLAFYWIMYAVHHTNPGVFNDVQNDGVKLYADWLRFLYGKSNQRPEEPRSPDRVLAFLLTRANDSPVPTGKSLVILPVHE